MSEKPEALRLIQHMDDEYPEDWDGRAIRAELRRQHAEIERLREALEKIATVNAMDYEYVRWARAALRREET